MLLNVFQDGHGDNYSNNINNNDKIRTQTYNACPSTGLFISSITFIAKFPIAPRKGGCWKLNIYHTILYFLKIASPIIIDDKINSWHSRFLTRA